MESEVNRQLSKLVKIYDNSEEKEIEKIVDSVKIDAFKEDTVKETPEICTEIRFQTVTM